MKKILLTVLIMCLILSVFSGCTDSNNTDVNATTTSNQSTEKPTTTVTTTKATTVATTTILTTAKPTTAKPTTAKPTTAATTTAPAKKHIKSEDLAGKAIVCDDWIITPMSIGVQMLKIKIDGSEVILPFIDEPIRFYYEVGDWIYYVDESATNKIYKIKFDGSDNTLLFEAPYAGIISTTDDVIYYYTRDVDTIHLFSCDLNFKNRKLLCDLTGENYILTVHNDYLFYSEVVNGTKTFYRANLNNSKKVEMPKLDGACFYKNYIFYATDEEIIKADLNGKTIEKFSATNASDIQIQDDVIYFIEDIDPYDYSAGRLVRMNFDGSNRKTIHDNKCQNFDVNGDIIVLHEFIPNENNKYIIRVSKINIDGTGYICYKDAIKNRK